MIPRERARSQMVRSAPALALLAIAAIVHFPAYPQNPGIVGVTAYFLDASAPGASDSTQAPR